MKLSKNMIKTFYIVMNENLVFNGRIQNMDLIPWTTPNFFPWPP